MMLGMGPVNRRLEKQQALQWCIIGLAVNAMWLVPSRLLGILPENGHPIVFPLVLFQGFISTCCIIWMQTVGGSLIADISDEHEYATGKRQEGMFFAAQGFSIKFVAGFGNFLGGIVIQVIQLPVGAEPGTVAAEVIFELGIAMGPLIAALLLLPLLFAYKLQMSRAQHAEIRAALDARATPDTG